MSIEGIELEHFSANKQPLPLSALPSHTHHAVFHSFCTITANSTLHSHIYSPRLYLDLKNDFFILQQFNDAFVV